MLPIPKHLIEILKPIGNKNTEFEVKGNIACDCSGESFTINLVGNGSNYKKKKVIEVLEIDGNYFLVVSAKCNSCGKEHLIFDMDKHGWDGFVCGGAFSNQLSKPKAQVWPCNKCEKSDHLITVTILSKGQADFIEEGEGLDKNDWAEAFSWIIIKTVCNSCKESNNEWISYETM